MSLRDKLLSERKIPPGMLPSSKETKKELGYKELKPAPKCCESCAHITNGYDGEQTCDLMASPDNYVESLYICKKYKKS